MKKKAQAVIKWLLEVLKGSRKRCSDFCFGVSLALMVGIFVNNVPQITIHLIGHPGYPILMPEEKTDFVRLLAIFVLFVTSLIFDKYEKTEGSSNKADKEE